MLGLLLVVPAAVELPACDFSFVLGGRLISRDPRGELATTWAHVNVGARIERWVEPRTKKPRDRPPARGK